MVEYEGPAKDENAWHLFYVEGHPPLLAKFPGIRKIEIYTPATLISALPFAQRRSMQRNKTVFDSADAMNAAMASPVRAALRKDFHKFPEFSGATAIIRSAPSRCAARNTRKQAVKVKGLWRRRAAIQNEHLSRANG